MSIEAITWVLQHAHIPSPAPPGIPSAPTMTLALLGLANHASREGEHAFPSVRTLAGYARISERQVHRCQSALSKLGLIRRGEQTRGRRGDPPRGPPTDRVRPGDGTG